MSTWWYRARCSKGLTSRPTRRGQGRLLTHTRRQVVSQREYSVRSVHMLFYRLADAAVPTYCCSCAAVLTLISPYAGAHQAP